jgi:tetratricopeptide (TPR) repeat protein
MGARKAKKLQASRPSRIHRKKKVVNSELLGNAIALHQAGRLQEAEMIYQSILQQQPKHPDALHLLGVIAFQSGKNEVAVDLMKQAIVNQPDFTQAHNNLGNALKELGQYEEAISHYKRALSLQPDYAVAHNSLGVAFQDLNRHAEALSLYDKAIALQVDYADAHKNKGIVLQELNRHDEAIQCYVRVLNLQPNFAEVHNYLANALTELSQNDAAITHYEQALAIRPDYAEAHNNLANALQYLGNNENAIKHYDQAIALEPKLVVAINNKGRVFQDLGKLNEAIECFEKVLELKPDFAEAHHNLSTIKPDIKEVACIENLQMKPALSDNDKMHLHYALANILIKSDQYDKTFDQYNRANELKRKNLTYDAKEHTAYIDKLIKVFSNDYFEKNINRGNNSDLPVFIVGMPRSGTTLVEQILSSHPQVFGAGELSAFTYIESKLNNNFDASDSYPECMTLCDDVMINDHVEYYLKALKRNSGNAVRITDKMPSNFLRIGLIKTMFPNARIIHCQRNPLDTCLSIYTNYFVRGNQYTYDLTELGQYYLDYERLMSHWHNLFGSQIFEIQYEELVMNQEVNSKQLIKYLDIQWNDECMNFYKNKRAVKTASNLQVRQPMYSRSINRWKNYKKQLEPLRVILNV